MARCPEWVKSVTDGEWGTACGTCRFVGITGASSMRFDTSITTKVAWVMGVVSGHDGQDKRMRARVYRKE